MEILEWLCKMRLPKKGLRLHEVRQKLYFSLKSSWIVPFDISGLRMNPDRLCACSLHWTHERSESHLGWRLFCLRFYYYFIYLLGWIGIESTITETTYWPSVPALDHGWWWWLWSNLWNEWLAGDTEFLGENCPSAALSTINPTLLDPSSNAGRHGGWPATNRLSYGTAHSFRFIITASRSLRAICQIHSSQSASSPFIHWRTCQLCNIWDFHGGDYEEWRLLGCYALWLL
jgi:hypothetical protein